MKYPIELIRLISFFKKLPGVGNKTAERFAFSILDWKNEEIDNFANQLSGARKKISSCVVCGTMKDSELACDFCEHPHRNQTQLCIISSAKDVFSIESTHMYQGLYHVLTGLLSPMKNLHPKEIGIDKLMTRIENSSVKEIIIALDSTIEGDTTALYLKEILPDDISVFRLAFGLPIGSSLDFVDGSTLSRAFMGRQKF
ncbi:MAG: recombination mediator RecR [Rhabdochlamydiaceae bacterium]